ncbi:hypothetical protein Tco_1041332 [Tanacetum coccineum]|uniref:Uncharacterized protein n=1 Tax=Tanacetum coccineum TaxID=301880 RepID=A0ABQ5GI45_9ASTR
MSPHIISCKSIKLIMCGDMFKDSNSYLKSRESIEDFVSFREMITSQLQGKLWLYDEVRIMDMINDQDMEHILPPTLPKDIKPPVGSPILSSPYSSVGSSSPVRSTTPPPDYSFDESSFAELDNSLWIIPRPLESELVPEKPNESDAC